MNKVPNIEDLVPHTKPMLLLNRLLEAGEEYIVCEVLVHSDGLFDTSGQVPALVGIEYMAQAVSAFSGLEARRQGKPVKMGFLLGTRRFETNVADFCCGEALTVKICRVIQGNDGIASFDCTIHGEKAQQSARLTVYEPDDPESYVNSRKRE